MRTVNRISIVLMLVAIGAVTACMGENKPDKSELGEVDQLLTQCGFSCPANFHPTGTSCNLSCGSCIGGNNQVTCDPNSGTFQTCGFSCPSSWHPTGSSCNLLCGSNCVGGNNWTTCAPN